jgi:hypothetical protein
MSAGARRREDRGVPVIELPTSRPDRAWSHAEPTEVVAAIDRWNNEGGFVPDDDAGPAAWRRRHCAGGGGGAGGGG